MKSPEQNSFPLHEFVDNYKPVPYTGASVEQTIMQLEGKLSDNIPWYASVRANISDKPVRQAGRLRGVLLSDKPVRQE